MKEDKKDKKDKLKWGLVGLIVFASVCVTVYLLHDYQEKEKMRTYFTNLMSADNIAVVMDHRGAPDTRTKYNIDMCGIGVSGSPALADKPKYIYGIEKDRCIISYPDNRHDSNASVDRCDREINEFVNIIIRPGSPRTVFEERSMIIYVDNETNMSCRLTVATN